MRKTGCFIDWVGCCFQVEGHKWHLAPEALSHIYKLLGADGRFLALGHFLLLLKNCYVLIRRDSITTVVYTDCLRHLLCDITQPGSHSDCVEQ